MGPAAQSEFVVSSVLCVEPEQLWLHAVSPAGVNRELRPLLRMTFPARIRDLTLAWRPGERLFRSRILLAGLLPIDYDDLCFVEIDPGRRFLERSSLFSQRVWEHERTIEPAPAGCRVTDRVQFVPRLPRSSVLYRPIFRALFRWRHRNLRRLFGQPAPR